MPKSEALSVEPESESITTESEPVTTYNKSRKTQAQYDKAAKLLSQGKPISQALTAAGWSPIAAQRGKRAISGPLLKAMAKQGTHLRELGRQSLADPNAMHELAVGRTAYATLTGDSKGLEAAKQLGSHKSVNCWQPDTQLAVQVNLTSLEALEDDSLIKTVPTIIK